MLHGFKSLLILTALLLVPATTQAVPPLTNGIDVKARVFDISQVVIDDGRMKENEVCELHMAQYAVPSSRSIPTTQHRIREKN